MRFQQLGQWHSCAQDPALWMQLGDFFSSHLCKVLVKVLLYDCCGVVLYDCFGVVLCECCGVVLGECCGVVVLCYMIAVVL